MKRIGLLFVALVGVVAAMLLTHKLAEHMALGPIQKIWATSVLQGVTVIDYKTGRRDKNLVTGLLPHNLLLSADGRSLFVSNVGSQSVSMIDVATQTKLKDILVGEIPENAYHTKIGAARMSKATSCYECHHDFAVGTLPNSLTWAHDGKHLLVNQLRKRAVSWLDPEAGKTIRTVSFENQLPTPSAPANVVVNPVNGELWVLHRFEASDYKRAKQFSAHEKTDFAHDPPAGQHFSWVTVHDPEMTKELGRIKMEWAVPFSGRFSPDGKWLYVAYRSTNKIAVFDTQNRTLARTIETSVAPTGLDMNVAGTELYVTCLFSKPPVVQVIDAQTGYVKVSFGVRPSPNLIVTDPATGYLYVTAAGYNAVLEIDAQNKKMLREFPTGHQPLAVALTR